MVTWNDVLDAWEKKIAAAEQALINNDWDFANVEPFELPDDMPKPAPEILERYENLSQRSAAAEQRITAEGANILSQLESSTAARGGQNRFDKKSEPSILNERV